VELVVGTNHGGRMQMNLCPLNRNDPGVNQACFDAHPLRRVDTNPLYNNKVRNPSSFTVSLLFKEALS
jgi:hypothetical protein